MDGIMEAEDKWSVGPQWYDSITELSGNTYVQMAVNFATFVNQAGVFIAKSSYLPCETKI